MTNLKKALEILRKAEQEINELLNESTDCIEGSYLNDLIGEISTVTLAYEKQYDLNTKQTC